MKEKTWDNEIISLVAQIHEYKGRQEIYLKQKPEKFLPRMKEIFADCGVAFVLLPHLKNAGVNGAVKWINDDRVVLAMNNRGVDVDKF